MAAARIVVVEDEPLTRLSMARFLESENHEVRQASDVEACRAALRAQPADIVILDLGLPGADGLVLARELKEANVEVIVVTMRSAPEQRIVALDSGADDYLVKPVHFGELAARIRVAVRRRSSQQASIAFGNWIIDLERRALSNASGEAVSLTRGEFDVLAQLAEAGGKIIARDALSHTISRGGENPSDIRSVDALISRLRRKLSPNGKELIVTAPGFGYRLNMSAKRGGA